MRLLPREEKFFVQFLQQTQIISQAAALLGEVLQSANGLREERVQRISDLEQEGDRVVHEVFKRLNQTFITPLDPEDLHSLASSLDDVLDGIEESALRCLLYQVDPDPAYDELYQHVATAVKALAGAFEELQRGGKLLDYCIEINRVEGLADTVLNNGLRKLFAEERDPIKLIKHKEMLELLEQITDRCEDVTDTLQTVMIKNS